jgi:hypothetical protein
MKLALTKCGQLPFWAPTKTNVYAAWTIKDTQIFLWHCSLRKMPTFICTKRENLQRTRRLARCGLMEFSYMSMNWKSSRAVFTFYRQFKFISAKYIDILSFLNQSCAVEWSSILWDMLDAFAALYFNRGSKTSLHIHRAQLWKKLFQKTCIWRYSLRIINGVLIDIKR